MNELSLFNDLFNDFGYDGCLMPSIKLTKAFHTPRVDVKEEKGNYQLEMDLPGMSDKDLDIELDRNVLTISSKKEDKKDEKKEEKDGAKWLIHERSAMQFTRSFTLPEDVDSDNLSAHVKDGILTVTMPRKALASPKRIAITAA